MMFRRVMFGFMLFSSVFSFLTKRGPREKKRRHLPPIPFRGGPLNPFHRASRLAGDEQRKRKYSDFRLSLLPPSPFVLETIGLMGFATGHRSATVPDFHRIP